MTIRQRFFSLNFTSVLLVIIILTISSSILLVPTVRKQQQYIHQWQLQNLESEIHHRLEEITYSLQALAQSIHVNRLYSGQSDLKDEDVLIDLANFVGSHRNVALYLLKSNGEILYSQKTNDQKTYVALSDEERELPEEFVDAMKMDSDHGLLTKSLKGKMYLGFPIVVNKKVVGYVSACLTTKTFESIMKSTNHVTASTTMTGEYLLLSQRGSILTATRFPITEPMATSQLMAEYYNLRSGQDIQSGLDYRGVKVLYSMQKLDLGYDTSLFLMSKIDSQEAYQPVILCIKFGVGTLVCMILLLPLVSYLASMQMVRPLNELIINIDKYGTRIDPSKVIYDENDEIRILLDKFFQLTGRLEKTTVSRDFINTVVRSLKEYVFIVNIVKPEGTHDHDFRITMANDAASNALGLSKEALMKVDFSDLIENSSKHKTFNWLIDNVQNIETHLIRSDGQKIPILVNWSELPKNNLDDNFFVFVCTDMTKTKETEKKLVSAREEALSANQAKSEFLARMSHEMRTPLNAIMGMAELLRESQLRPDQERLVSIFYNAGENLLALINDILDISKIEAREIHIESIPLDLPALVKNVHDLMQLRAESKGLELKLKIHPEITVGIKGDPTRLRQVIMNLVGNAIKFTEKGYVQITVNFADDLKKDLIFSVTDTGLGIPKDKHSILFNSFVQADSSITRKFGGTGLGLVISKNLAHLMGGKIWFESDAGKGSTFSFTIPYLPVADSEIKALYGEPSVNQSQPIDEIKPMTVLIVDDSEDNRFLLINYLKKIPQLKVIQAENGLEAFTAFKENQIDLIFMDIQMPEMDGYQSGALIRAWEADHHKKPIPMIALSANAMLEDIQKSLQNGFNQHVSKPVKRDVIIAVIQQYANGSSQPQPPSQKAAS